MATSEYAAYVAFAKEHVNADYAVSVATMRSKLINNLNHIADECAQVRVKYVSAGQGIYPITTSTIAGVQYALFRARFAVSVKPDGSSYLLRVRLAGHVDSTAQNPTATFKATVGHVGEVLGQPAAQTVTATNTSATVSTNWLDGASVDKTYVTVPARSVARAWTSLAVVEGSQSGSIDWALLDAMVWGSTNVNDRLPNLRGFVVEEFIGL